MENVDIARLLLPAEVVEKFEIVRAESNEKDSRIDIWLDEKKVVPTDMLFASEVIAYGFTPTGSVN